MMMLVMYCRAVGAVSRGRIESQDGRSGTGRRREREREGMPGSVWWW
jgi:hypothetical protein